MSWYSKKPALITVPKLRKKNKTKPESKSFRAHSDGLQCSALCCLLLELSVPAEPSCITLHPWGSAASSAHYSELCPSDTIHLQRNAFGSGGEFSESCVWVSATWLLLTLMEVTQLETHALPLGLCSPLMCVDCSTH